jgi:hypothetical protein
MHTVPMSLLIPTPQTAPSVPPCIPSSSLSPVSPELSPKVCPNFTKCNAPICPLDPHWPIREMMNGDATCSWFREMAKAGPTAHGVPEFLRAKVGEVLPIVLSAVGLSPLRSALKRAAKTGSKRVAFSARTT